jgi:hypothetical protein
LFSFSPNAQATFANLPRLRLRLRLLLLLEPLPPQSNASKALARLLDLSGWAIL